MYQLINIKFKWQIKGSEHYKFTVNKKLYNCKTMREINRTVIGVTIGYCINGKFKSLKALRTQIELIPKKEILPF